MARKLRGKSYTWEIGDDPIGSGDAGEVYSVICLEDPSLVGVMKKPARIATGGTIQRQANQIAQEALALARLNGLPNCKAHPPRLLDTAPDFTQGSANFFMVSESAPGEDLANMLAESRQSGKPFPRRVIITVLDALFDLFSRAHKAGVLWNDVKLDHIYWHNLTGDVAVIDWGNAQFLDNENDTTRRTPPRWEDYQQLVDTLGTFLKGTAPELYADLGWEEFEDKELDLPKVSVLARRIAYQQELVGLRVMEYQSLIRVEISEEPSLDRLQKIVDYQHRLNQIGAPWDSKAVLEFSQTLILESLANGSRQSAIKAVSITWELFGESLDLHWHLIREYFRKLDIISHPSLYDLVKMTMNQSWSGSLWILVNIARENGLPEWWDQLVPVLRQKALGTAVRQPYQIGLSVLEFIHMQGSGRQEQIEELSKILKNWHTYGEDAQENPFDYRSLDFIQKEANLPRHLIMESKSSFAIGQKVLRDVIKAWDNMDWDALQKALQQVICWDPDRWGIISLAENVDDFMNWLERLYQGPEYGVEPSIFFTEMIGKRPKVEQILGSPGWFLGLDNMLKVLMHGQPVSNAAAAVNHWCPWLLAYETLYGPIQKYSKDEELVLETLRHFSKHLKNWSDLDAGLKSVGQNAPQYLPSCKKIINNFNAIANLNIDISNIAENCQNPPHETLRESCEAALTLKNWRGALGEKDYHRALSILDESSYHDWRFIDHAHEVTALWINQVQPLLKTLLDHPESIKSQTSDSQTQRLYTIYKNFKELKNIWEKIYTGGISSQLLDTITSLADSNRSNFLEWRRVYEHSKDRLSSLVYYFDLEPIRLVSDNFLRISQHSRQARLGFSKLQAAEHIPFITVIQISENILDHLLKVEELLKTNKENRRFPGWLSTIQQINNAQTQSEMRDYVLKMSPNNPLYAWLVQSLLAQ